MIINVRRWLSILDNYYGNIEYRFLLTLAALHKQKVITDEKLKGQLKALKAGTLQRNKRTYHCTINDTWYNDVLATEVLRDLINRISSTTTLSLEEFVTYIMKYNGMNYNYGINIILTEYVKKMFDNWNPEYNGTDFAGYIGLVANIKNSWGWDVPMELKAKVYSSSSCDGWCSCCCCCCNRTTYYKNETEILKTLEDYFHGLKKGNLKKIPKLEL